MVKNTEKDVAERIKQKHNGTLEYISGYKNKDSLIKVKCLVCGEVIERTYHHLTTHPNACPVCKQRHYDLVKAEREKQKQEREEERKRNAEARKAEVKQRIEERKHACPVCGTITTRRKYCSKKCADRAHSKTKEHRRRMRLANVTIDKDITVEGLFRRDKGICYICGGKCDYEDYTVRDGIFIAGDWYPSIDHVKPISKGGLHRWDNVRLAHRHCNTLKGAKSK